MSIEKLTESQIKTMAAVSEGADVYGYGSATDLRAVQRECPDLITITKPQAYEGDGTDRMPYFGAILTDLGRNFINEAGL